MFQLVKNMADPESETKSEFLVRSNFNSLEEAKDQAYNDVLYGYRVLGILNEDPKKNFQNTRLDEIEDNFVWTPKKDKKLQPWVDKKIKELSGE